MTEFFERACRCPDCRGFPLVFGANEVCCQQCGAVFPLAFGKPVLVRHDNEIFPLTSYSDVGSVPAKLRFVGIRKVIPSPSVNLAWKRSFEAFVKLLDGFNPAYVLVVGSGRQRDRLENVSSLPRNIRFVYADVDVGATVDLFCDAHELPFKEQVFHGVIATALLEHVLYPELVVAEMYRLLVNGGVVYSEVPFMQQVHEGAYDFTRYTLSGHRRLFNQFREISSGLVAGPATALVWSLENFASCFMPSATLNAGVKLGVRLALGWIKYLDYILQGSPGASDSASSTYFLGRKEQGFRTPDKSIIDRYPGSKHIRHV